jgi:hypothetical protein
MDTKSIPVWLYHAEEGARLFTDVEASVAARKAGWKDSPADLGAVAENVSDRDSLVARAEGLGIQVDKRWGVKRIQQAIEEHDDRA